MSATRAISGFALPTIARSTANTTSSAPLQVVCAFPLSSNYGPGSRILYYVLVAACVTFRKAEWLRNACLAVALVLPAISALQALVLVSSHVNGAVDLDIYGAFQFCAIGILAAPLTVRLSRTYFYDPGRNIIFVWTILILMGLVALCVEFYRVTPTGCSFDNTGARLSSSAKNFPYGRAQCGLTCSEDDGPISPMRGGAASNVYVIPVPRILTFNAVMLLAAGFCIPAILGLIFTWDKILEINWKRRRPEEHLEDPIEGANITVGEMKGINAVVRKFLGVVEIPLFGGVILTIMGLGEANFFSPQLMYETEPMAALGQWSPIAGTLIATIGSLYLLWSSEDHGTGSRRPQRHLNNSKVSHRSHSSVENPSPGLAATITYAQNGNPGADTLELRSASPNDLSLFPTFTNSRVERTNEEHTGQEPQDQPINVRHRVRTWLNAAANRMGNVAHENFDISDFKDPNAHRFPEVPGEGLRNPNFQSTSVQYDRLRENRAASEYAASVASVSATESRLSQTATHEPAQTEMSSASQPMRRATLEVPAEIHRHHRDGSH